MEAATAQRAPFTTSAVHLQPASILIVGPDQQYIDRYREALEPGAPSWSVSTSSAEDVIAGRLDISGHDVFLVDYANLDADGVGLLKLIRKDCPSAIRIVLAEPTLGPPAIDVMNVAHQALPRQNSEGLPVRAVTRALSLRGLLQAEQTEAAVGNIDMLPALPQVYIEFVRAAQTDGVELPVLAGIIEQDVALSAKVLQLVNSAFFGLRSHVKTLEHAVSVLGIEMVSALVTSTTAFTTLTDRSNVRFAESLWIHSRHVGDFAERFLTGESDESLHVEAIQASLLHDIGRLVIQHSMPRSAKLIDDLVRHDGALLRKAEKAIIGGTHEEVGAYLLSLWGFHERTVDVVLRHHDLEAAAESGCKVSIVVAVANCLAPADGDYSDEAVARRGEEFCLKDFFAEDQVEMWIHQAIELMNE